MVAEAAAGAVLGGSALGRDGQREGEGLEAGAMQGPQHCQGVTVQTVTGQSCPSQSSLCLQGEGCLQREGRDHARGRRSEADQRKRSPQGFPGQLYLLL